MLVAARQKQQQPERSSSRSKRAATPRDYRSSSGLEAFGEFFCTYLLQHVEGEPITAQCIGSDRTA